MTIAPVGTLTTSSGSGLTTLGFTSVNDGAVIAIASLIISTARTITGITGHGATFLSGPVLTTAGSGVSIELWYGKITAPQTQDITVTWSSSTAGIFTGYDALEFNAGLGRDTIWSKIEQGGQDNPSATTVAYPTLGASSSGYLYAGHAYGDMVALDQPGSTPGFTYVQDSADNQYIYNPSISGSVSPTSGVTSAQSSHAIGLVLSASRPRATPQPRTARRRAANF
jgi:hypothetical protein